MTSVIGGRNGFTLIELALVGAILGVIVSIGWPSIRGYGRSIVARADARRALVQLRAAREQAVLMGCVRQVDVAGTTVHFFPDGTATSARATLGSENERWQLIVDETGRAEINER